MCVSVSAQSLCSSGVLCEADVVFQSQHRVCVSQVFCVMLMLCVCFSVKIAAGAVVCVESDIRGDVTIGTFSEASVCTNTQTSLVMG